jgi:hypothetical protein
MPGLDGQHLSGFSLAGNPSEQRFLFVCGDVGQHTQQFLEQ